MIAVVQGFAPFGDLDLNPSEELVLDLARRLQGEDLSGDPAGRDPTGPASAATDRILTEVLPVSWAGVSESVPKLMAEHRPDVWIGLGVAAGRPSLALEAVAVNLADSDQPDNDGVTLARLPVRADGPPAHLSTLPVEAILRAWREAGIPGYLSQSAGSYLCNMSFYLAASSAEQLGLSCRVGFLHLPLFPVQVTDPARQPSMAPELQAAGLRAVIEACRHATLTSESSQGRHPVEESGLYLRRSA